MTRGRAPERSASPAPARAATPPIAVRRWVPLALLAVPVLFLAAFFVLPVGRIVALGLAPDGQLELGVLGRVVTDPAIRRVAWFTLWQAVASTLLTLAIGLPGAYVLSRLDFPGRGALRALVTVPFVLPTVVVGSAFLALLGPRSPVNGLLVTLFGDGAPDPRPAPDGHRDPPRPRVLQLRGGGPHRRGAVGAPRPRIEDAARVLGASRWRVFHEITLPLLRPAIAATAAIVFLFTFTSFGVVLILGGATRATIEVEIHRATTQLLDLPLASALALLQLTAVVAALAVYGRLQRTAATHRLVGADGRRAPATDPRGRCLPRRQPGRHRAAAGGPAVVLVERSFVTPTGTGSRTGARSSGRNPTRCWRSPRGRRSATRSGSASRRRSWPWWSAGSPPRPRRCATTACPGWSTVP
jgi:thiamine transport system permease protein